MARQQEYKRYTRSRFGNVVYFAFLFLMGAFSVLPLVYCICTSLKPLDELLVFPPRFFVYRPTLENFAELPALLESLQVPLSRYLFNSVFISVVSTALQILVASMAAYVLSKTQIRGRTVFFLIVQFSLLYNGTTLAVPQYLIFSKLGLIDTLLVYTCRLFRPLWAYFCASSISTRACRTRCLRRRASTARGPCAFTGRSSCPSLSPPG